MLIGGRVISVVLGVSGISVVVNGGGNSVTVNGGGNSVVVYGGGNSVVVKGDGKSVFVIGGGISVVLCGGGECGVVRLLLCLRRERFLLFTFLLVGHLVLSRGRFVVRFFRLCFCRFFDFLLRVCLVVEG